MSFSDRSGLPELGRDFDLERWTDGTRDAEGSLVWHETYPSNDQWDRVSMVTINMDPEGEGDFRNVHIDPDRPLNIPGTYSYGVEDYIDIYDIAATLMDAYGVEY